MTEVNMDSFFTDNKDMLTFRVHKDKSTENVF
jgi:hypothetical protein